MRRLSACACTSAPATLMALANPSRSVFAAFHFTKSQIKNPITAKTINTCGPDISLGSGGGAAGTGETACTRGGTMTATDGLATGGATAFATGCSEGAAEGTLVNGRGGATKPDVLMQSLIALMTIDVPDSGNVVEPPPPAVLSTESCRPAVKPCIQGMSRSLSSVARIAFPIPVAASCWVMPR